MSLFITPHSSYFSSFDPPPLSLDPRIATTKWIFFDFSSIDDFSPPMAERVRMWTVLSLANAWAAELMTRVIYCFRQAYKELFPTQPVIINPTEKLDDLKNLKIVFHQPVDYEDFRNKVLTYKNGFYNNFGFEAFSQLNRAELYILNHCKTKEEEELKVGMAVYDAIVNLYLKRLFGRYPELNNKRYLPCLRTIALAIAIKMSCDEAIENESFQCFIYPYMGTKLHSRMEIAFLKAIDWNISITELSKSMI